MPLGFRTPSQPQPSTRTASNPKHCVKKSSVQEMVPAVHAVLAGEPAGEPREEDGHECSEEECKESDSVVDPEDEAPVDPVPPAHRKKLGPSRSYLGGVSSSSASTTFVFADALTRSREPLAHPPSQTLVSILRLWSLTFFVVWLVLAVVCVLVW
jgi:hypothetical protein